MATEEMKTEPKKTEQKQSPEIKDIPPPEQHKNLPQLPLPHKTCSFKVSIHCEGCKRKVKKILNSVEGVYKVDIDVKQQKVTVMGIAAPEFLLKKLLKAGKHVDLLPEIPDPGNKKPVDPKEKNTKKKKNKEEKTETNNGDTSSGSGKPESEKPNAAGECGSDGNGESSGPKKDEKKVNLKEKNSVPADSPSPAAEKKAEETSGNAGKKKKKKGQSMSSVNKPTSEPVRTRSPPPPTTPAADHDHPSSNLNDGHQTIANNSPPSHYVYPYPPSYYAPEIMYGVSYNVAQPPVNIDSASYYTPPPPHSYAYMHPGYLPLDKNPYHYRPYDSFELFSDENPNGCSVM